ncbi:hypothetical protein BDV12DRAFT_207505 [Aspergillus spectabilis]
MDDIVSQIQTLASEVDPAGRATILHALRQVLSGLGSPKDIIIQLFNEHLRNAIVRVGIHSGIFQLLSKSQDPLSAAQMAEYSGAHPQMFERIVRYLASNDMIQDVGQGQFKANNVTHVLASPAAEAFISHSFDVMGPAVQAFPDFLVETGYADISDNVKTPFQKAFDTDLPSFAWLAQHPKHLEAMTEVMKAFQSGAWMNGLDEFEKGVLDTEHDLERVFFVDVGGGSGHQCVEVRDKYPNLKGRLVLQELPEVIKSLTDVPGVKIEAHNFFEEQTVIGAKVYYLRRILHDWPDAKCVQILQHLRSAMASDSRILIDEMVLPDTNVPWQSAMADLSMMITLAGKERSKAQWAILAKQSGLQIAHIHNYEDAVTFNSVIVLEIDQTDP